MQRILRNYLDVLLEQLLGLYSRFAMLYYRFVANIMLGQHIQIFGIPIIRSPRGCIVLGDRVQLISSSWRASASGLAGPLRLRTILDSAKIVIEDGVGINGGSITARSGLIRIGKDTMIGPDCMIVDSDFHLVWPPEQRYIYPGKEADADVLIGARVWLGARCIVLKGATIGDNSVIAAGSVVVGNIPSNCLAAGVPARVKRKLGA